jgi:DAACS family dicarboxylate/amino acid:cation (Na+ or H+) symporter
MTAQIGGRIAGRLLRLLALNTLVAICIGLLIANVVRPGQWSNITPQAVSEGQNEGPKDILTQFLDNVPKSLLGPLGDDGKVIGVIFIAVAFGIALRSYRRREVKTVEDVITLAFDAFIVVLHWIIDVIPLAIFGIVASIIGTKGFADFQALVMFVVAVLIALFLQAAYYLVRVGLGSWVRPLDLLRHTRDALVMAFATASSTVTMPVTYSCLRDRVGLRERSTSMGSLVGANFNNDGTALYEAMSALFISQMIGQNLGLEQQLLVVLTSVVASVGAAGIPEAGLVTMTLVFSAVGLPTEYIAILLTVDWFLDRCRTAINVMGDMNVSCLLDGKVREERAEAGEVQPIVAPLPA